MEAQVVVLVLFSLCLQSQANPTSKVDVCQTDSCKRSAEYLLSSMNESVNPCDDFYEFACGGWIANAHLPEFEPFIGIPETLRNEVINVTRDALENLRGNEKARRVKSLNVLSNVYQNCLNTDPSTETVLLKEIRQILKEIGGWPLTDPKWDESKYDPIKAMAFIQRRYNVRTLLDVGVNVDVTNTSRMIVNVQTPFSKTDALSTKSLRSKRQEEGIGDIFNIAKRAEALKEIVCWINPNCTTYQDVVNDTLETVGIHQARNTLAAFGYSGSEESEIDLAKISESVIRRKQFPYNIEPSKQSSYSVFEFDILDNPSNYKKTIKEAQDVLKAAGHKLNLLELLNGMLSESGTTLTDNDEIYVVVEAIKLILAFYENEALPKRAWANVFGFQVVSSLLPLVSNKYRTLDFDANKDEHEGTAPENYVFCTEYLKVLMPNALSRLFADSYFPEHKKKAAQEMTSDLKLGAKEVLYEALGNWMDANTHMEAVDKLNHIQENVGYPEWIMNDTILDSFHDIDQGNVSGPLDLVRKLRRHQFKLTIQKLSTPTDREQEGWSFFSANEVNAFYHPPTNVILIPGGFLNFPAFELDRPKALNYGAIGWLIGHEITHGFDDTGRRLDGTGHIRNWWTKETAAHFEELAECFVQQYSNITDTHSGNKLNGRRTLSENIADNGGLRAAFKAYKKVSKLEYLPGMEKYDEDQLFFLSAANMWCGKTHPDFDLTSDSHSPERYRVLVPFGNSADFARSFQCPLGSNMNPVEKCVLW